MLHPCLKGEKQIEKSSERLTSELRNIQNNLCILSSIVCHNAKQ